MNDQNNNHWETQSPAFFCVPVNEESMKCYMYQNDTWDLYKAYAVSDTTIKIEGWYRFLGDGVFEYDHDVCVLSTDNNESDFSWTDDSHTAFTITMQDENNTHWDEEMLVSFTAE